jgi:hypothetical protein
VTTCAVICAYLIIKESRTLHLRQFKRAQHADAHGFAAVSLEIIGKRQALKTELDAGMVAVFAKHGSKLTIGDSCEDIGLALALADEAG